MIQASAATTTPAASTPYTAAFGAFGVLNQALPLRIDVGTTGLLLGAGVSFGRG
jgi:hypothetical protein